jgi:hypothetical protein
MATTDTTITDKKSFSCDVVDKKKFEQLSQEDKVTFEGIRNSLLEIFPVEIGNTYSNEAIRYAENFAFIMVPTVNKLVDSKLEKITNELKTQIMSEVQALIPVGGGTV